MTLQELRQSRAERRLNDTVGVAAALNVWASSTTPRGGRVDYSATIRNEGPRRVRVVALSVDGGGLRIASRGLDADTFVAAGTSMSVPLSVRLDCATRRPGPAPLRLDGVVSVRPLSGSLHRVSLSFARASPLTSVAQTLCSIGPRRFGELSGPIL